MEALTFSSLRRVVKLYRDEIEGAEAQLDALIDTRAEDLARLVGFPVSEVPRLRADANRVELLVQTVEKAPRHHHQRRVREAREHAVGLLSLLVASARYLDPSTIELEPPALVELVSCPGFDWLVFDPEYPGRGIPRGLLHAFFRESRGVEVNGVVLRPDLLTMTFGGPRSRGVMRLVLQQVPPGANVLEVHFPPPPEPAPIVEAPALERPRRAPRRSPPRKPREAPAPAAASHDAMVTASSPSTVASAIEARPALHQEPPHRTPSVVPRFLRHLVDAASEVLR